MGTQILSQESSPTLSDDTANLTGTDLIDQKAGRTNVHQIVTYTGKYIDPCKPDADVINIVDIAHALGNSCRYGGHCPDFYSVAEHSCRVARLMWEDGLSRELQFAGLMHDAEEAYMPDIPTPIKRQFPEYKAAGEFLRSVIWNKFLIPQDYYGVVVPYDHKAYELEREELWKGKLTLKPKDAKHNFLRRFFGLSAVRIEDNARAAV